MGYITHISRSISLLSCLFACFSSIVRFYLLFFSNAPVTHCMDTYCTLANQIPHLEHNAYEKGILSFQSNCLKSLRLETGTRPS